MSRTIDLRDFPHTDARERFAAALADARRHPGTTIFVPAGDYVLTSALARRTRDEAISGAYGENPEARMFQPDFAYTVGLPLEGHCGTTLYAHGARLLIDGFMEPVCLKHCTDIRMEGLMVDHVRRPFSRGEIEEYVREDPSERKGHIIVRFAEEYPVDAHTIMPRHCAYDARTGRFNLDMKVLRRQYLGAQRVRFDVSHMPDVDLRGQWFYVWHAFHYRPAILIEDAKDIALLDVTIHSQPGMGVVGHRSENILMERLRVIPPSGEHMSTNTDATHFTSCKGTLTFRDCQFDGHGDDATNVHTFYHDIEPVAPTRYLGRVSVRTHSLTLDHPDVGDDLELVDRDSLALRDVYRVLSVTTDPKAMCYEAELDHALPEDAALRCWISNVTQMPRLTFSGCTTNNHWARSVLIKTRHALVENCVFTGSTLQAIHVAAEAWWHEGVTSQYVTIRGNRFVNCGITGHADVGGVKAEVCADAPAGTPIQHIVMEDNCFELPGVPCAIQVRNARGVTIARNRFLGMAKPVQLIDCEEAVCDVEA